MSIELRPTRPEISSSPSRPRQVAVPVKKVPFQNVVKAVLDDSRAKPAEYLDEVVVHKGGE